MLGSVHRLIEDGHELIGIFTFECDNVFNFNRNVHELAEQLGIPITEKTLTADDIAQFVEQGSKVFLSAGYPHKIPPIDEEDAYGLNIHPAYLPKGRGIMPSPYIIMDHPEAAGISIHKLVEDFDAGDILMQKAFDIEPSETVETLSARGAMAAPDMISTVFEHIQVQWKDATPQNEEDASYFPAPTDDMRILDWSSGVKNVDKTARAFGRYGSIAKINGQLFVVYDHDVWADDHGLEPGHIVCQTSREIIVSASDGYICLKDFQLLNV